MMELSVKHVANRLGLIDIDPSPSESTLGSYSVNRLGLVRTEELDELIPTTESAVGLIDLEPLPTLVPFDESDACQALLDFEDAQHNAGHDLTSDDNQNTSKPNNSPIRQWGKCPLDGPFNRSTFKLPAVLVERLRAVSMAQQKYQYVLAAEAIKEYLERIEDDINKPDE